jgi:ribonuclease P protein component
VVVHLATKNVDKATSRSGDGDAPARVGFVVSRAVGSAVTRNRVKRRLRHLMRERVVGLDEGSVLVVRALPAAAAATYADLGTELDRCLARVTAS